MSKAKLKGNFNINWELFEGNSSTVEAVIEVAQGDIKSFKAWLDACWPKKCKKEIKKIQSYLTIEQTRKRARRYLQRQGYNYLERNY
jgi:Holliday junction resolvase-like predicted endonuclease